MPFQNYSFRITKSNDSKILTAVRKISDEVTFKIQSIHLQLYYGGQPIQGTPAELDKNDSYITVLGEKTELVKRFDFRYNLNTQLVIDRVDNQTYDTLTFIFNNLADNHFAEVSKFISLIRKNLKSIDSELTTKTLFNDELKRHYELRESELTKLEEISESIIYKQQQFLLQKEQEYLKRKEELDEIYNNKTKELENTFNTKKVELDNERSLLDKKLQEINDHESKHERRRLREDLKKELKSRSEKFELTKGTNDLRKPIFIFSTILLILFGSGLVTYSILSVSELLKPVKDSSILISLLIKQISFALAFGSTSVFFIRWNNKWFEQHANEEFRLKRHEIDIDRASWIVEMALEWRTEKEGEIPSQLIDKLSQNLFIEAKQDNTELHPSDQLASAIFGAASNLTIKGPNDSQISFDRKGVQRLKKDSAT